ncbi:MAG: glycosyltransferase family 2 protein, partial [Acidobacteriota bacterium]|nr:glycosyltransferase family 2 protein [Acidobacteriota bacterium]
MKQPTHPHISIIIPTYARPRQLAACLAALSELDYPRERFEVIVVNDGGEIFLSEMAPFRQQINVTLITQPNAGPATARNTGAAQAEGEFLAFTDDDCAPARDWLQALANRFATIPDQLIGGRTLNALDDNLCSTASQLLIDYLY